MPDLIHEFLTRAAAATPDATAIHDADDTELTYRELDGLSDRVRDYLLDAGVTRGDRVGFCLPKSTDAIVIVFGILKAGAAYVPIDPLAPAERSAYIVRDSEIRLLLVDPDRGEKLAPYLAGPGPLPTVVPLPSTGGGRGIKAVVGSKAPADRAPRASGVPSEDDVAYIIYTSGSTGRPKGAVLTHRNAASYLAWASEFFAPKASDRFSLQFPLHFDPSVSDIFLPIKHGACIVPIEERVSRDPVTVAKFVAERRLTIWTSVPSALALAARHGRLESQDLSSLRLVAFGGEVFPPAHLRLLRRHLPGIPFINLYGPTETNVCTYFEIPQEIPSDRRDPYPIGRICDQLQGRVIGTDGTIVEPGAEGELCISGPNVMRGYWNRPDRTREVFFEADGRLWYRTGDIVREEESGLVFVGRRDRMVKRRGYRIELGEIEAALHDCPGFVDVAVVSTSREGVTQIHAVYTSTNGEPISLIALKGFCVKALPGYMVPDRFMQVADLPRTSTGKTDYLRITEMAGEIVSPDREPGAP